jgi:CheB methylesterase
MGLSLAYLLAVPLREEPVGREVVSLNGTRSKLPANTRMAFVLIQHMDPAHENVLNRLLEKQTPCRFFGFKRESEPVIEHCREQLVPILCDP